MRVVAILGDKLHNGVAYLDHGHVAFLLRPLAQGAYLALREIERPGRHRLHHAAQRSGALLGLKVTPAIHRVDATRPFA